MNNPNQNGSGIICVNFVLSDIKIKKNPFPMLLHWLTEANFLCKYN